jgi:hypothetical protein
MSDFKTAEQYVVEKVEELEKKLKDKEAEHIWAMAKLQTDLDKAHSELSEVYGVLALLRDNLTLGDSRLHGPYISVEEIYRKDKPDAFDDLLDALGLSLPTTEEEENDA